MEAWMELVDVFMISFERVTLRCVFLLILSQQGGRYALSVQKRECFRK